MCAQIIPIIGVWLGYFPLEFGRMFALAFSIYFPATHLLLYYCHDVSHMRSIFFSVTAGNMFWFAYAKACPPFTPHRSSPFGKLDKHRVIFSVTAGAMTWIASAKARP